MVVSFPPTYLERPVELLDEEQPNHLVGEGHGGEGEGFFGGGGDGGGEAEGAADDEGEVAGPGQGQSVQAGGQGLGGEAGAADVEDDEVAGGADGLQQSLALAGEDAGLVGGRGIVRHFLLGHLDDVEAAEGGEALEVFGDAILEVPLFYFADSDDGDAHGLLARHFFEEDAAG